MYQIIANYIQLTNMRQPGAVRELTAGTGIEVRKNRISARIACRRFRERTGYARTI